MQRTLKQRVVYASLMLLIFLVGSFAATQLTAVNLHFHPALGKRWIASLRLYNPLKFWLWSFQYDNLPSLSPYFTAGWWCIGTASFIIFIFAVWINWLEKINRPPVDTHGSAHFATRSEVKKSGLLSCEDGNAVYVGAYYDAVTGKQHYLKDRLMSLPSRLLVREKE